MFLKPIQMYLGSLEVLETWGDARRGRCCSRLPCQMGGYLREPKDGRKICGGTAAYNMFCVRKFEIDARAKGSKRPIT